MFTITSLKSTCSFAVKAVSSKRIVSFRALQTAVKAETKKSYVVLAYVDYRKEHGSIPIRTYLDRQKAIDFAESLSTKYVEPEGNEDEKESDDEEDDEEDDGEGPQYASIVGTEFDEKLKFPTERLVEFGVSEEDARDLWYTRIAVSVAEHFD